MILERFYNQSLAQASYLVACPQSREALVIDPTLDSEQYLKFAQSRLLRITAVAETHIHADFLSGAYALAKQTNAVLYRSGEGSCWLDALQSDVRTQLLKDRDQFQIGDLRLEAVHTPGHTPEHLAFQLTDGTRSNRPVCVFSGDFLFAGDVGRPDLLEKAAEQIGTAQSAARDLFAAIKNTNDWPAHLLIWPGHGAGSACGKSLDAVPVSSLGYERLTNWALQIEKEEEFARQVLKNQPEPPAYFSRMKQLNKSSFLLPAKQESLTQIITLNELKQILADGALLIDLRPTAEFVKDHLSCSIHLPVGAQTVVWAGSVIESETPLLFIAASRKQAEQMARQFSLIGLGPVIGWVDAQQVKNRTFAQLGIEFIQEIAPEKLLEQNWRVVDVRDPTEFQAEHMAGAANWPLQKLRKIAKTSDPALPVVLQCQSGTRSIIAVSLLKQLGWSDVSSLKNGLTDYKKIGLPLLKATISEEVMV